jgi:hypothetical protein
MRTTLRVQSAHNTLWVEGSVLTSLETCVFYRRIFVYTCTWYDVRKSFGDRFAKHPGQHSGWYREYRKGSYRKVYIDSKPT